MGMETRAFHLQRSKLLAQAGAASAANEERELAEAIEPRTPLDFFLVGDNDYREGRSTEAIQAFQSALRLEPEHFWSHYFLALCYLDQRHPSEAVAHLTAAVGHRPDFAWIYLLRGYAYGELNQFDTAEADFAKARQLGANDYGFYINRGAMRLRRGRLNEAIDDFKHAISLRPEQYQAYVNLAEAHRLKKEYPQALKELDIAIERSPTVAGPHRVRAQIQFDQGKYADALASVGRALALEVPGTGPQAEALALRGTSCII